jgi:hypothetical protein
MFRKATLRGAKKLHHATSMLRKDFRNNVVVAVLAAFGLVIALAWRDVIQSFVDYLLLILGIQNGGDLVSKIIVASIVTIICVIGILIFSKYKIEK